MAIRRTGGARPGEQQVEQQLGRVRVSIDDLEALVDELHEMQPDATIQFSARGATFDKPEDIRDLTDRELRELLIETPMVDVQLSRDEATAFGLPDATSAIATRWARARQIQGRPLRWYRDVALPIPAALLVGVLVTVIATGGRLGILGWENALMPLMMGLLAGYFVMTQVGKYECYADIQPFTIAEARAEMKAGRRFTTQVVIAVSSAVVGATVAIILFLLRT